jgi:hypothetical protein
MRSLHELYWTLRTFGLEGRVEFELRQGPLRMGGFAPGRRGFESHRALHRFGTRRGTEPHPSRFPDGGDPAGIGP